jgi:hypothetical protein
VRCSKPPRGTPLFVLGVADALCPALPVPMPTHVPPQIPPSVPTFARITVGIINGDADLYINPFDPATYVGRAAAWGVGQGCGRGGGGMPRASSPGGAAGPVGPRPWGVAAHAGTRVSRPSLLPGERSVGSLHVPRRPADAGGRQAAGRAGPQGSRVPVPCVCVNGRRHTTSLRPHCVPRPPLPSGRATPPPSTTTCTRPGSLVRTT